MPEPHSFTTVTPTSDGVGDEVETFVERTAELYGRQPIDEHRWRNARHRKDPAQQAILGRAGGAVAGLALITPDGDGWSIDTLVDPDWRYDAAFVHPLARHAVDVVAAAGGGRVQLWVHEPEGAEQTIGGAVGLPKRRGLHQMRVPLPLDVTDTPVATRPFVVGEDEHQWLAVNAAAFAGHPDQGHWTIDDLLAREAEPWFDPAGFLLHEVDGRLAGFCWTKVHGIPPGSQQPESLGEIYVIGVHPDFGRRGLGRGLCIAGLDHLAERASTGMLYVDSDNIAAVKLYQGLGFHIDHSNLAFAGEIAGRA